MGAEKQVRALRAPRSPSPTLGGVPCSPREGGSQVTGVCGGPAPTAVLREAPGWDATSQAGLVRGGLAHNLGPCSQAPPVLGNFLEQGRGSDPHPRGPRAPPAWLGGLQGGSGGGVEGGGGDREAVAVSRPWAAGAVMLRDPPLPRRRNHAGPLRLCAATDQNPGAHPGRPPVPPLRSPRFRPRAARRQLPRPAGPLEAACAPKDGQSLVTVAPRHRLAINSLRTSSSLISISWAGGLGTRAGWSLGCWRASWRRGPAAVPQGSRESRITQVHPSGRWVLPPESATKASEE